MAAPPGLRREAAVVAGELEDKEVRVTVEHLRCGKQAYVHTLRLRQFEPEIRATPYNLADAQPMKGGARGGGPAIWATPEVYPGAGAAVVAIILITVKMTSEM